MAVTHKEAGAKLDPLSLLALGASGDYPLELNFSEQVFQSEEFVHELESQALDLVQRIGRTRMEWEVNQWL